MYDTGNPNPVLCDNLEEGWGGRWKKGSGGRGHIYACGQLMLLDGGGHLNIVNYPPIKINKTLKNVYCFKLLKLWSFVIATIEIWSSPVGQCIFQESSGWAALLSFQGYTESSLWSHSAASHCTSSFKNFSLFSSPYTICPMVNSESTLHYKKKNETLASCLSDKLCSKLPSGIGMETVEYLWQTGYWELPEF